MFSKREQHGGVAVSLTSKKVLGSNPVWCLPVCVGSLRVLWMQFRERRVRLVDYCKLDVGVNVIMNGCLSLCVCNKLVTSVGYTLPHPGIDSSARIG